MFPNIAWKVFPTMFCMHKFNSQQWMEQEFAISLSVSGMRNQECDTSPLCGNLPAFLDTSNPNNQPILDKPTWNKISLSLHMTNATQLESQGKEPKWHNKQSFPNQNWLQSPLQKIQALLQCNNWTRYHHFIIRKERHSKKQKCIKVLKQC